LAKGDLALKKNMVAARIAAFCLPILIMGGVFALLGVYPFGENTLLILDMNSEYIDYYAQLRGALLSGDSLMRSWNMGMGLNMLGLVAFYTASPFLLLLLIFPVSHITEAVLVITLLKFGLGGFTFSCYAGYTFRLKGAANAAFSVVWALIAYNVVYSSNLMWLDGAAFLPLVLLGVEKLLREDKYRLFFLSLLYVFLTSYYIGYMIGLFSFLYLVAVYFAEHRDWRVFLRKLGRFLLWAALAAACCAFLLIPAYLNLSSGQSSMWDIPLDLHLNHSLTALTSKFLPGAYDSLTDSGTPNLYCNLLTVLLALLFFGARGITRREKTVFGCLLGFLLLCLSCRLLDLGWHAFEDPTWYPARYSFVVSFLCIHLALRGLGQVQTVGRVGAVGSGLILLLILLEAGIAGHAYAGVCLIALCIAFALAYGLLLWAGYSDKSRGSRRAAAILLCVLVCGESAWSAYMLAARTDAQFQYKTRESYTRFRDTYGPVVEKVRELDGGVYRMELTEQRSANGGMALGYGGVSHYSTTTDQNLNYYLQRLSYNNGTANELRFAPATPATNGILGIRYVLSKEELGDGYSLVGGIGDTGIYQNLCAYPLAFYADYKALRYSGESDNPFALVNDFVRATGAADNAPALFTPLDWGCTLHNVREAARSGYIEYHRVIIGEEDAWVSYSITNGAGRPAYAYFPLGGSFTNTEIFVNDSYAQPELAYRHNTIVSLGAGENPVLDMRMNRNRDKMSCHTPFIESLDVDEAQRAAQAAGEYAMDFDVFTDTRVSGSITAPRDGLMVTTIPYDEGWTVEVDGAPVRLHRFSQVFLAVELPSGAHRVDMHYRAPGLLPGGVISAATVTGILVWWAIKRLRKGGGR